MAGLTNGGTMQTVGTILNPRVMQSLLAQKEQAQQKDTLSQLLGTMGQEPQAAPSGGAFKPLAALPEMGYAGAPAAPMKSLEALPQMGFPGKFNAQDLPGAQQAFDLNRLKLLSQISPQTALSKMFPADDEYTLKEGEQRIKNGRVIASGPAKAPEGFKTGATREVQRGATKVTQEYDGTSWKDIATGPAWAPNAPTPPQVQEFFDNDTGRPYKAERQPDGSWKRVGGFSTPSKTFNNDQNKAAGYALTMSEAEKAIANLTDGKDADGKNIPYQPNPIIQGASSVPLIGGALEKTFSLGSPEYQQYKQKAKDWTLAILRQESGANVPDSEADKYWQTYFPQPGDDAKTIEAKKYSRDIKMRGVVGASGGAFETLSGGGQGGAGGAAKPKDAPQDAKQGNDGGWYTPDPARPGKFLKW